MWRDQLHSWNSGEIPRTRHTTTVPTVSRRASRAAVVPALPAGLRESRCRPGYLGRAVELPWSRRIATAPPPAAAVSASISTPVRSRAFTVASTRIRSGRIVGLDQDRDAGQRRSGGNREAARASASRGHEAGDLRGLDRVPPCDGPSTRPAHGLGRPCGACTRRRRCARRRPCPRPRRCWRDGTRMAAVGGSLTRRPRARGTASRATCDPAGHRVHADEG